jgi:hypothetical protein
LTFCLLFYHLTKAGALLLGGADEAGAASIHDLIEKERDLILQPAYLVLELGDAAARISSRFYVVFLNLLPKFGMLMNFLEDIFGLRVIRLSQWLNQILSVQHHTPWGHRAWPAHDLLHAVAAPLIRRTKA